MGKLGLEKRADVCVGPNMRWLTVVPMGQISPEIVLQKPGGWHSEQETRELLARVGQGTTWVFQTDDCRATYETLRARGITFVREPTDEPYGLEALFVDLYGNSFSLLQPR